MRNVIVLAALLAAAAFGAPARAGTDWTTFGGNVERQGYNGSETVLTSATVPGLREHWQQDLGGPILTQPTVVRSVATAAGSQDLVFAATLYGTVFALNAQTGAAVWETQLGEVQTSCQDFSASNGNIGVIGTPTIDLPNQRLLVVDGTGLLHALALGSGGEEPGFPLQVLDKADRGISFVYGSPALFNDVLYVATSSACDSPSQQHGEVIFVDLATLQVPRRWFVTGRKGPGGGGIWGFGGVSLEDGGSYVYAATGNAFGDRQNSPDAEHIVQLNSSLYVVNANRPQINGSSDSDFGATPLIFDPPGCPLLLAAMNKSGQLFLYDRNAIGSGPVQALQIVQDASGNGNFIGIPAYDPVTNAIYFGSPADNGPYHHGLLAMGVTGSCRLSLAWNRRIGLNGTDPQNPMIPPTVAADVVWYADGDGSRLAAFDAGSGAPLWNSHKIIPGGIFAAPTVANGQVFVGSFGNVLYAFGL